MRRLIVVLVLVAALAGAGWWYGRTKRARTEERPREQAGVLETIDSRLLPSRETEKTPASTPPPSASFRRPIPFLYCGNC